MWARIWTQTAEFWAALLYTSLKTFSRKDVKSFFSVFSCDYFFPVTLPVFKRMFLPLPVSSSGLSQCLSGKESACKVEDTGSIPRLGGSLGVGNGNPLQYSCLGKKKLPWTEVTGRPQSMGLQRVGPDWATEHISSSREEPWQTPGLTPGLHLLAESESSTMAHSQLLLISFFTSRPVPPSVPWWWLSLKYIGNYVKTIYQMTHFVV